MNFYESKVRQLAEYGGLSISPRKTVRRLLLYGVGFGFAASLFFLRESTPLAAAAFALAFILVQATAVLLMTWIAAKRAQLAEELLPDFLTLLAANLRSGLTLDKALLLSSRKEFGPLAEEADRAAKKSVTGAPFDEVLSAMTLKIDSANFRKTMNLIVEGVRAGGSLPDLLDKTAFDMRRFSAVRKEVRAHVLLYELFIFFATAIGAPLLYAASTFLTQTITGIKARTAVPAEALTTTSQFSALAQGKFSVSADSLLWFSVSAVLITSLFGSMAIGAIGSGKKTEGLRYFPAMLLISLALFFLARMILESLVGPLFA